MDNINHSERAHSPWGASSAERWMACPGSIALGEKAPPQGESKYAAEGTCAHELAEAALVAQKPCMDFVGREFEGWVVTDEMAEFTQVYVDYVNKHSQGGMKELYLEERFDLSFVAEGLFGTNDACISEPFGTLEIIDLKYGKGVEVSPIDNKQLKYYALGAAQGEEYSEIKLTIIQPRVENPIKSWVLTPSDLSKFEEELKDAVLATKQKDAKLDNGSHCKFCSAKSICPQLRQVTMDVTKVAFAAPVEENEVSLPEPKDLTAEQLQEVLENASIIRGFIDAAESHAFHLLENGGILSKYKLVKRRSNRKVRSEQDLIDQFGMTFGDKLYDKKLLGIGKLEKLVGKKELAEFLIKPEAGNTIAHYSDKRPEVKAAITTMFDEPIEEATESDYNNMEF